MQNDCYQLKEENRLAETWLSLGLNRDGMFGERHNKMGLNTKVFEVIQIN